MSEYIDLTTREALDLLDSLAPGEPWPFDDMRILCAGRYEVGGVYVFEGGRYVERCIGRSPDGDTAFFRTLRANW